MHRCEFCKKEFGNAGGLKSHLIWCSLNPNGKEKELKKFKCEYCDEAFNSTRKKNHHYKKCEFIPKDIKEKFIPTKEQLTCNFCNNTYKSIQARNGHIGYCKLNPNRIVHPSSKRIGEKNPNFGGKLNCGNQFTKYPDWKVSKETRKKLSVSNTGKKWSKEKKEKHSKIMKKVILENPESYCHGNKNGRTKIYEHNGFKLRGTWELEVAKYLDEKNIMWTNKIEKPFNYLWKEKEHLYFPDFYLPEYNKFIEVKGYKIERDSAKWASVENLIIIMEKEIKQIRNNKYNIKDFLN